ncbi:hypothetical protein COCMIDRAFT_10428 [Bipolaris oryzae ATCC 44560]|uniref:NACHT domain-containing protein n=1 Tax=Bipolaris oryzae ATCC 44560 TaxID=930090 RepID=W6YVF1_COCMI|nr:uncharacterized protein COCMIDRAFT_10428 [Bipolaris oryzae ATCC 44560]EUC39484.1 hypothetical protein COCMIDRAFT_10428 [Bipolaris oryzae ATCC 44560]
MASPVAEAFEAAKREFLSSTSENSHNVLQFASIKAVYDATDKIQREHSKSGTLRNLRRIEPYLDCLQHYAKVIDTFVRAKLDVLALIWGPLRIILLATKTYIDGYEKIWDTMAQVGVHLPQYEKYTEIFSQDDHMKRFLSLFYKDILDFHSTLLEFFDLNKAQRFFEVLWPKYSRKIQLIIENIAKYKGLMDSQANLNNIVEAEAARAESYRVFEQIQDAHSRADFEQVKTILSANLYDDELEKVRGNYRILTKSWLESLNQFKDWVDPNCSSSRLLWLQGILGAGKTFLVSLFVRRMKSQGDPLAFAFLSYRARNDDPPLQVFHTFMIQLAIDNKILQPMVTLAYRNNSRQLSSSVEFATNLIKQMLEMLPTTYFVVDGLDDILEVERRFLLEIMLQLHEEHENLKLLISGRPDHDIVRMLSPKVTPIRVEDGNGQEIQAYVQQRSDRWLSSLTITPEDRADISTLMGSIGKSAKAIYINGSTTTYSTLS